jgi:hypothetical protein
MSGNKLVTERAIEDLGIAMITNPGDADLVTACICAIHALKSLHPASEQRCRATINNLSAWAKSTARVAGYGYIVDEAWEEMLHDGAAWVKCREAQEEEVK